MSWERSQDDYEEEFGGDDEIEADEAFDVLFKFKST